MLRLRLQLVLIVLAAFWLLSGKPLAATTWKETFAHRKAISGETCLETGSSFATRGAGNLLEKFKPTQTARHFDMNKVKRYADMMRKGSWDWAKEKVIVDKAGNIISGHHRVLAAEQAGVSIPKSAIFRTESVTPRVVQSWADILKAK